MKKVIFIDLDGTLKNDQKQVSQANIDALVRAKAAGYEIVFSSGRSFPYIDNLNQQVGGICRYAVASTGSVVYDLAKQKILASTPLSRQAAAAISKFAHPEIMWLVHCTDGFYSTEKRINDNTGIHKHITQPVDQFLQTKTVCATTIASHNFDLIKNLEPKILAIPKIHISNRHKALANPTFTRRGLAYYDIVADGVSKGSGVRTLCNILDIPKEERIAIGDDTNDLSMFAECGLAIAMGNALPEIKAAANQITDDNNSDGVANFLLALLDNSPLR